MGNVIHLNKYRNSGSMAAVQRAEVLRNYESQERVLSALRNVTYSMRRLQALDARIQEVQRRIDRIRSGCPS